jgi:hypothetical protein
MVDAARRGPAENVDHARDPVADVEEAADDVVGRDPDPVTVREAFEREIAERGESEIGEDVGTLIGEETETERARRRDPPPR